MRISVSKRRPSRELMANQAQLAGLTGSVMFQIARERLTTPRPTTLREVPPSPEHLANEWLTRALCDAVPGARVIDHHLGPRNDGTSARRTLRVDYNDDGVTCRSTGVPVHQILSDADDAPHRRGGRRWV
jgi:hypothetical protein